MEVQAGDSGRRAGVGPVIAEVDDAPTFSVGYELGQRNPGPGLELTSGPPALHCPLFLFLV
jgi:hypothetical protein